MMTNGAIGNMVRGVDGPTVTVTYRGGEKKIDIPMNVPVVELEPATKARSPGVMVFVPADKLADGALVAGAVVYGKDGVIPPM